VSAVVPRRRPKAHLKADGGLSFEYILAKELGMTHKRLLRELGPGELAYWRASFELEHEHFNDMRAESERKAAAAAKEREWRAPRNS
jgi:hypothetical protein